MGAKKSSYEGLQKNVRRVRLPAIEVWENQYAEREYAVTLEVPEFTCICPKTGLPDFAQLRVIYAPRRHCLELKSFKMYIVAYRNMGIFHEHLTNRVLDDIVKACRPRWARVEAVMNPRGGITTSVAAEYRPKRRKKTV